MAAKDDRIRELVTENELLKQQLRAKQSSASVSGSVEVAHLTKQIAQLQKDAELQRELQQQALSGRRTKRMTEAVRIVEHCRKRMAEQGCWSWRSNKSDSEKSDTMGLPLIRRKRNCG